MGEIKKIKKTLKDNIEKNKELIEYLLDSISAVKKREDRYIIIVNTEQNTVSKDLQKLENSINSILSEILDFKFSVVLTAEKISTDVEHKSTKIQLDNIKHIIAIASGKGGVGKSTITRNIASAMSYMGLKVGILDADILGPSQAKMLGYDGNARLNHNKRILPVEIDKIKTMSIAYMLEDATAPIVWRGPMLQRALLQMFKDVEWGELDILLIDMPPGTGDISLNVAQNIDISGVVIVSTPQDIALLDAIKSLEMFRKLSVDIIGIVENMSIFICPNCRHESHIFGHEGAKKTAKKLNVNFLGEVPLLPEIREASDKGKVIENITDEYFLPIARNIFYYLNR